MAKKVLIPNRGVIALDIINSLNSLGLETILLHSPEDALSLPVRLADKSYKFFSSRLEDSYMDQDTIIEKALELGVDYIHPGYGFLSERPEFAKACRDNNISFIGPDYQILEAVRDKINLKKLAESLDIKTIRYSGKLSSPLDAEAIGDDFKFPVIIKPVQGSGGKGIKVADFRKEAQDHIKDLLKREENRKVGIFIEEYLPYGQHIEVPFFRDVKGNILILPEIESSIQRRFQKIFQESPSPNVSEQLRRKIFNATQKLIQKLNYVGLGFAEFIVDGDMAYFSEINPTFQINTLIPELQITANFVKKQFAISRGELLHDVEGVRIIEARHHVLLVSLMAENPDDRFQPSTGTITEFFHYSAIRNIFKTNLYTGARIPAIYDPYIGKIVTYAVKRENAIKDLRTFLDNIIIRGIHTNLNFLKHLMENKHLKEGKTINDFLNLKCNYQKRSHSEEELMIATALLAGAFHIDNRKKNYKSQLEKMKQPGLLKRLLSGY